MHKAIFTMILILLGLGGSAQKKNIDNIGPERRLLFLHSDQIVKNKWRIDTLQKRTAILEKKIQNLSIHMTDSRVTMYNTAMDNVLRKRMQRQIDSLTEVVALWKNKIDRMYDRWADERETDTRDWFSVVKDVGEFKQKLDSFIKQIQDHPLLNFGGGEGRMAPINPMWDSLKKELLKLPSPFYEPTDRSPFPLTILSGDVEVLQWPRDSVKLLHVDSISNNIIIKSYEGPVHWFTPEESMFYEKQCKEKRKWGKVLKDTIIIK